MSIAPLGSPVVPLVNTISARVSAADRCGVQRLDEPGEVGQRLDEQDRAARAARRSRLGLAGGEHERRHRSGAATLRPNSIVWRTSSGTETPPAWATARNPRPHSGRLTAQMIDPVARASRPASARSRATRGTRSPRSAVAPRPGPERRPDEEGRSRRVLARAIADQVLQRLHRCSPVASSRAAPRDRRASLAMTSRPPMQGRVMAEHNGLDVQRRKTLHAPASGARRRR